MQPESAPRPVRYRVSRRHCALVVGLCSLATASTFRGTPDAIAQGETRTLTFVHSHTRESATITFKRWGSYDYSALEQANWLMRDWRRDEKTRMNPKLFDVIWESHREVGSSSPVYVNSAYRSPETNSMLRRRSRAVAKHSQHMNGNAMDFVLADVSMSRVREVAMRFQRGGVGYYPSANTPFVHLDVGSVRSWPRMTRDQLVRLFPDEQTVHLPAGGGTMAGYESARATIIARGGTVGGYSGDEEMEGGWGGGGGFLAALFGGFGRGRGNGGSPVVSGDDAGMRAVAMNTPPAGASVAVASAGSRSIRGRRGRGAEPQTQIASAAPVSPFLSSYAGDISPTQMARQDFRQGSQITPPQIQQPAPAPAQIPVAAPPPVATAPIQIATAPQPKPEEAKPKPQPVIASLPMPPRRPADLARFAIASAADLPLPPTRPTAVIADATPVPPAPVASAPPAPTAADALGAVIRRTASPDPAPRPAAPVQVAAYAPVEAPLPPTRPGLRPGAGVTPIAASANATVAIKPETTGSVPTAKTRTLAAPVAARVAMAPVDAILSEFRRKADVGPSAGVFSGAAVKPLRQIAFQRQ